MAWKQMDIRQQRVEFAVRAWRGESISGLCREYGIRRPTGYLWKKRFVEEAFCGWRRIWSRGYESTAR